MIYFHVIVLQVENWCPRLPWRAKNPNEETDQKTVVREMLKHEELFSNCNSCRTSWNPVPHKCS